MKFSVKTTLILILFLLLLIFLNFAYAQNLSQNLTGSCIAQPTQTRRPGGGVGCVAPYVSETELIYFGEPCTELGYVIENTLGKECTDVVKFFIENTQLKCENENDLNLTLGINETQWVICKSFLSEQTCKGVHSATVVFCNTSFSFKYGILKARILFPENGSEFNEGEDVLFSGIGDRGINTAEEYEYEWYSDSTLVSRKKDFSINNLSIGKHEIIFKVKKVNEVAENKIVIEIKPFQKMEEPPFNESKEEFPSIILLPVSANYSQDEKINFMAFVYSGTAPYEFQWLSSIDGFLSNKKEFSKDLSIGEHTITLIVKDSKGFLSKDNVSLIIKKPLLKVKITSPKESDIYRVREAIELDHSVTGFRDSYEYTWKLNNKKIDGNKIDAISEGTHRISIEVVDSVGNFGNDSITIHVREVCNENNFCDESENFLNCPQDCNSGSKDNYCDSVKDGICDVDCSRNLDVDCLCNNDKKCEIEFENFANCKEDCPSGGKDNYCDSVKDGICDPDCKAEEDSDCIEGYLKYLMLLFLVILIFIAYLGVRKFIKR